MKKTNTSTIFFLQSYITFAKQFCARFFVSLSSFVDKIIEKVFFLLKQLFHLNLLLVFQKFSLLLIFVFCFLFLSLGLTSASHYENETLKSETSCKECPFSAYQYEIVYNPVVVWQEKSGFVLKNEPHTLKNIQLRTATEKLSVFILLCFAIFFVVMLILQKRETKKLL